MAYAQSNPPSLVSQRIGDGPAIWIYKSTDAKATVIGAGYITNAVTGSNGVGLGMRIGDIVFIVDSATPLGAVAAVTAINTTTGAANLTYLAVA